MATLASFFDLRDHGLVPILVDKPEKWRRRAAEARKIAKAMKDPEAQRTMEEVTASYGQLAERCTTRLLLRLRAGQKRTR